jgi:hypothetical protein
MDLLSQLTKYMLTERCVHTFSYELKKVGSFIFNRREEKNTLKQA